MIIFLPNDMLIAIFRFFIDMLNIIKNFANKMKVTVWLEKLRRAKRAKRNCIVIINRMNILIHNHTHDLPVIFPPVKI